MRCAVEVQRAMADRNADVAEDKRIEFRIGIHVGDIVVEQDDIFGDGVNVAARLEALADPGGICVSARVQEDAEGRLDVGFVDDGEHQLKNIARPVRVYRVAALSGPAGEATRRAAGDPDDRRRHAVDRRPAVPEPHRRARTGLFCRRYRRRNYHRAVALSRPLFVIARNSTFTYKGRAVDVKQVGRELNVRYVLEGSVRKAGNRLRITGQLVDAATAVPDLGGPFRGRPRGHLRPAGPGGRRAWSARSCRRSATPK